MNSNKGFIGTFSRGPRGSAPKGKQAPGPPKKSVGEVNRSYVYSKDKFWETSPASSSYHSTVMMDGTSYKSWVGELDDKAEVERQLLQKKISDEELKNIAKLAKIAAENNIKARKQLEMAQEEHYADFGSF